MSDGSTVAPFGDEDVDEIPLADPPIDLALAQIRFPRLTKLANDSKFVAKFATAVSDDYPIAENPEHAIGILVDDQGVRPAPEASKVWRIKSGEDDWSVSISDTFLAIQTKSYPGRTKFVERLAALVEPFAEIIDPPYVQRLGVRYINRIHDQEMLNRLPHFVRSEVLGPLYSPPGSFVNIHHSISETLYQLDGQMLQVKSGFLSPGLGYDPIISVADHPTWILDLDAFSTVRSSFSKSDLTNLYKQLAGRSYRYFRWAVTPEFLERFRGPNS